MYSTHTQQGMSMNTNTYSWGHEYKLIILVKVSYMKYTIKSLTDCQRKTGIVKFHRKLGQKCMGI